MNEPVMEDWLPVYPDYWYVADGKPVRSPGLGTVEDLKAELGVKEIRKCDLAARGINANFRLTSKSGGEAK